MKDQKQTIYTYELSNTEPIWKVLRHRYNNCIKPTEEYVFEEAIFFCLDEAIMYAAEIYAAEITEAYPVEMKITYSVVEFSFWDDKNPLI